jgi:hypothetical protein
VINGLWRRDSRNAGVRRRRSARRDTAGNLKGALDETPLAGGRNRRFNACGKRCPRSKESAEQGRFWPPKARCCFWRKYRRPWSTSTARRERSERCSDGNSDWAGSEAEASGSYTNPADNTSVPFRDTILAVERCDLGIDKVAAWLDANSVNGPECTEAAFRLICFLFNLIADFQRDITRDPSPRLMTLRPQALVAGAILGADGRKRVLRLGLRGLWRERFAALLKRISELAQSTVTQFVDYQKYSTLRPWKPRRPYHTYPLLAWVK